MEYTDSKYSKWCFTINANANLILPQETDIVKFLEDNTTKYGFQLEKGTRDHYQGFMVTKIRKRQKTILREFAEWLNFLDPEFNITMVTINKMMGTIEQNVLYCSKSETSTGSYITSEYTYSGKDIERLSDPTYRYDWQNSLINLLVDRKGNVLDADNRSVSWITDPGGGNGKSVLVKYLCYTYSNMEKISFGSSAQLRSALVGLGPKRVYFIDIPRTLGKDDSLASVINVVEELTLGFITSNMYGKHEKLMMDPPHVVMFSNSQCPEGLLSSDRWRYYGIIMKELRLIELY